MDSFTPSGIVTLLTDFGHQDTFVGQMKGVILGLDSSLHIVDLTHCVLPQNIEEGAFQLRSAIDAFPAGTVHIAVVDPGVGTARKAIVVESEDCLFVGPDNGLLSPVISLARRAHQVTNRDLMRDTATRTFHGRDVFAPVGARLAGGQCTLDDVGPAVATECLITRPASISITSGTAEGSIVSIDRFGNCITLLEPEHIGDTDGIERIECGDLNFDALHSTFADVSVDEPVAYIGSSDTLELGLRDGNAAKRYGLKRGDLVRVLRRTPTAS